MWIEINYDFFNVSDLSIQYKINNNASISFNIDLKKNNEYYDFFVKSYEDNLTFLLRTTQFIAKGCLIKILDIDFLNKISVVIICNTIENDISKIRNVTIGKILDNED